MNQRRIEEIYRNRWWSEKLQGLFLDEACRIYVLNSRPRQQTRMPEFDRFDGTVSMSWETLKGILPEEWYISLQIPDTLIARMVWTCRRPGMPGCQPCSSGFAEKILKLYKKRRGDFIREHSFQTLKFLWLEYGSIGFPQAKIIQAINQYRRNTEC